MNAGKNHTKARAQAQANADRSQSPRWLHQYGGVYWISKEPGDGGRERIDPTTTTRHHATKKKSPAQLQREIDEALHATTKTSEMTYDAWREALSREARKHNVDIVHDGKTFAAWNRGEPPSIYAMTIAAAREIRRERAPKGRTAKGGKRSHSTMKTEEPTHRILARWESRSGKHWVELTQHDSVTIANALDPTSVGGRAFTWFGYTSPGSSGSLAATTSAAAIAEMEQRVKRGDFLPDAAKTSMKRVR